jgi:PAS domain S-box-containing protein
MKISPDPYDRHPADITPRSRQALLETERNLLRMVIDNVPDYIFVKDQAGRFVLSNLPHAKAAGVSTPDELIGKSAQDVFPQDVAPRFHEDDQRVMESGEALVNEERMTVDAEGNRRWVLTTKVPMRDAHGQVIGLVGLSRDITVRKQAQEMLWESEARFRSLFEDAPLSLWEKDYSWVKAHFDHLRANGVRDFRVYLEQHPEEIPLCLSHTEVLDANDTALGLYKAGSKEALLKNVREFVPEDLDERQKESLIAIAEGQTHFQFETVNRTLTGIQSTGRNLAWSPGHEDTFSKVLVSVVDITERKRAEAAMRQRERFRASPSRRRSASFSPTPRATAYANRPWGHLRIVIPRGAGQRLEHGDSRRRPRLRAGGVVQGDGKSPGVRLPAPLRPARRYVGVGWREVRAHQRGRGPGRLRGHGGRHHGAAGCGNAAG